jgi:hypothetical protein
MAWHARSSFITHRRPPLLAPIDITRRTTQLMGRKFLTHASAGKESGYEGCTNGRTKSRLNARLDGRSAERTLSPPVKTNHFVCCTRQGPPHSCRETDCGGVGSRRSITKKQMRARLVFVSQKDLIEGKRAKGKKEGEGTCGLVVA